jgi:hypothetical protein
MRQTGVKIAGAAPSHESLPTRAALSAHDLEIEDSSYSTSTAVMIQPDGPFATESEIESGEEPNPGELGESHGPSETKIETTDPATASSSVATPAASPPTTKAAPSRSTVIQEVMDWIAEPVEAEMSPAKLVLSPVRVAAAAPPEQGALEDDRRLAPSGSPSSSVSFYQMVEHAGPASSPAAKFGDDAWSVHIGAIHLEIEAPREPSPRAVAPQPASPAASESRGPRLRRYYLRPC